MNLIFRKYLLLTPLTGTLLFLTLYLIAATLYPGGSQADSTSKGFSWIHNYWCNLLNVRAMNGDYNPARPVALAGTFILCCTLSVFWYLFPKYVSFTKNHRLVVQFSGMLAMLFAMFLFTDYHNLVISIAGFFGIIALTGTFRGLYRNGWYDMFYFGVVNLLLIGLNNFVYYTRGLIIYLPVIQKISFASFLVWICWINVKLYAKVKDNLVPEDTTSPSVEPR